MTTSRRPAIIKLGSTMPSLSTHRGDFEEWVLAGMAMRREDLIVVDPRRGEALPALDGLSGAVLTGSHATVAEHADWSERTADWLRRAVLRGLPILGICYGHQLLAYALGGEVGNNPQGSEFGEAIKVQTSHSQSVLKLPPDARVLASSDMDPHLAFVVHENVWGVQFHPEFDVEIVKAYIRAHRQELHEEGQDADALIETCEPSPAGPEILQRFTQLIAEPGGSA